MIANHSRRSFLSLLGLAPAAKHLSLAPWHLPKSDDDFWAFVRAQYPLTRDRIYFNTGGLGPAPHVALQAQKQTIDRLQLRSETGHRLIDEARPVVAVFIGARAEEVAFMRNATEGNATVASGLDLRAGDEVIFESHAHPGGSIPWMNRQKVDGIKVKIFEPDPHSAASNLERIEALITDRTRVIQVSHVTAPTGIRMPVGDIAELAKDKGLWFHIDGAQSAGMFPVDIKAIGCDSYATSGHKWIGAPHGTGLLYIREDRLDDVTPTDVGAYSDAGYNLPDQFTYNPTAQRYECGTRDAAQIVGFREAVNFIKRIGQERIAAYIEGLALHLNQGLREIEGVTVLSPADPGLASAMTTFKMNRLPYDQVYRALVVDHQMRCRVVTERGLDAVRVSTHLFNNQSECDQLIEAIRGLATG